MGAIPRPSGWLTKQFGPVSFQYYTSLLVLDLSRSVASEAFLSFAILPSCSVFFLKHTLVQFKDIQERATCPKPKIKCSHFTDFLGLFLSWCPKAWKPGHFFLRVRLFIGWKVWHVRKSDPLKIEWDTMFLSWEDLPWTFSKSEWIVSASLWLGIFGEKTKPVLSFVHRFCDWGCGHWPFSIKNVGAKIRLGGPKSGRTHFPPLNDENGFHFVANFSKRKRKRIKDSSPPSENRSRVFK